MTEITTQNLYEHWKLINTESYFVVEDIEAWLGSIAGHREGVTVHYKFAMIPLHPVRELREIPCFRSVHEAEIWALQHPELCDDPMPYAKLDIAIAQFIMHEVDGTRGLRDGDVAACGVALHDAKKGEKVDFIPAYGPIIVHISEEE